MKFLLKCTYYSNPEQYDVYYKDRKVGYIRLRHYEYRVEYIKNLDEDSWPRDPKNRYVTWSEWLNKDVCDMNGGAFTIENRVPCLTNGLRELWMCLWKEDIVKEEERFEGFEIEGRL